MFKLAKSRNKSTKDLIHIRQMKDESGSVLIRWKQHFQKLLNEENDRYLRGDGEPNDQEVAEITREEVNAALKKIKNGKAMGPDDIPVETLKKDRQRCQVLARLEIRVTKDLIHITADGPKVKCVDKMKQHFQKLLNEENDRYLRGDGEPNDQEVAEITREEVNAALKKIKNGKAMGPDDIPVEISTALCRQFTATLVMGAIGCYPLFKGNP
ncbi:uncharacterized protein LOC119572482 [Penaeus monodon]|uniref:uncharacterized protein LOC119572482 n=1 Tax=Penaeus monodon TaxID=6687 RepID=UPI0018A76F64|nr:uncharacterized protein LOC119572482 [Penaeus monodon]